jgi:hypothetical protein
MKKFVTEMFSSHGKVSSKRVVTLLAFLTMVIGFIVDLFSNNTVSENIYTSMEFIVIAGLGFTASERFGKSKKDDSQEQS